jgi:light-harvesting complex I chlorophyll a/b binding protein 1
MRIPTTAMIATTRTTSTRTGAPSHTVLAFGRCAQVPLSAARCPAIAFPDPFAATRNRRRKRRSTQQLFSSQSENGDGNGDVNGDGNGDGYDLLQEDEEDLSEAAFLRKEIAHLESLEELLRELEEDPTTLQYDDDDDEYNNEKEDLQGVEDLFSFLQTAGGEEDGDDEYNEEDMDSDDETILDELLDMFPEDQGLIVKSKDKDTKTTATSTTKPPMTETRTTKPSSSLLEDALLEGVVPAQAGVGSECLAGDFGFDPLDLATKDYPLMVQSVLLNILPGGRQQKQDKAPQTPRRPRPSALILRDYREAEIRHGRLAMLAALIWPLQEMLDRLLLDEDQFAPLVYGPVTLSYFPLLMTLAMMLLGYLDIYSQAIKDRDEIGEAFMPGDCFWDPLAMLQGAPTSMKRNMQERELFNGRVAMLAVAAYFFEEVTTHLPLISIEGNDILFLPAYQIPFIQEWLDAQFYPTFDIGTMRYESYF